MQITNQRDFLANVNRMFDNHPLKDENMREKFISRATAMKDMGIDITEMSKITGSFMLQFDKVTLPGPDFSHEARLEALSRRYAEMRDELNEMFKDDETEFYRQMERMNAAFEQALINTCLMPVYPITPDNQMRVFTQGQEAERIRFEEEIEKSNRRGENARILMNTLHENLLRHTNTFFESFINSIRTSDFETAFGESMALLKSSETTSLNDISYSDMMLIMDATNKITVERDSEGSLSSRLFYNSAEEAFRALVNDDSISIIVRKAIAERFNFAIIQAQA
jgi:hypothetical protein